MRFKSVMTSGADPSQVGQELISQAGPFDADLAVLFATHHYGPDFEPLLQTIHEQLNVRNLVGCSGENVIGPDREVEAQPAAVLWLADLPQVRILPFLLDQEDLQNFTDAQPLMERLGVDPADQPSFIMLADPYSFDILTALKYFDEIYPGAPKVGGLASGADEAGQNRLFLGDQALRQGLVGVALAGPVQIDTVVSQGCRPIGVPLRVTAAQANIIEELDDQRPYDVLKAVYANAHPDEQQLMQRGVHVGVVIDEGLSRYEPGDFLVQNLLGVYEGDKLAITSHISPGQTIQFHVRDASSADLEMRTLLASRSRQMGQTPTGGLLFSCNGRGRRMFDQPNHDIALVNQTFPACQIAGFFAAGEIGPVGGRTFIHGFTSSLILFREALPG
ncbi:MAG: hypothetical protein HJJLKODD_00980 [Phycisphaerae bacterium]|nr:hypothetical protein [Phycisphaerae bacterium]